MESKGGGCRPGPLLIRCPPLANVDEASRLVVFPNDLRPEYYNLPRQMFPKAYHPNGYIDIIKTDSVMRKKSLHGENILGFITPVVTEVDQPQDFDYLEFQLTKYGNQVYEYLKKNFSAGE